MHYVRRGWCNPMTRAGLEPATYGLKARRNEQRKGGFKTLSVLSRRKIYQEIVHTTASLPPIPLPVSLPVATKKEKTRFAGVITPESLDPHVPFLSLTAQT